MLEQEGIGKSVAYTSHSLSCAERHYAQTEKEMLSLLLGLSKFHHYTYGRDVVTDHKPLVAIRARALVKAPAHAIEFSVLLHNCVQTRKIYTGHRCIISRSN